MKKCNICLLVKPFDEFVKRKNRPNGIQAYCKKCHNENMKSKDRSEYNRKFSLNKSYGITIEEYNKMFTNQNGCCAICKVHITEINQKRKKHLSIDHNHRNGKIRGLLCDKCNRGIGLLQDDVQILLNAFNYLNNQQNI
jgi:ribosomal protein L34E